MDLKQKLTETKNKIKENLPVIIAAVSAGVAIGATAVYVINKSNQSDSSDEETSEKSIDLQGLTLAQTIRLKAAENLMKTKEEPRVFLTEKDRERMQTGEDPGIVFPFGGDECYILKRCTDEH